MAPKQVTVGDLQVGLTVEYLGDEPDPGDVLDERLRSIGMALYQRHPGRIWDATVQHVRVTWVGLEDEPASFALGFSFSGDHGTDQSPYPGLGHLTEELFERRRKAIVDVLASGRDLSEWVPSWSGVDSHDA